jgi:hypothetical protein
MYIRKNSNETLKLAINLASTLDIKELKGPNHNMNTFKSLSNFVYVSPSTHSQDPVSYGLVHASTSENYLNYKGIAKIFCDQQPH